jgi:hypothetical protein
MKMSIREATLNLQKPYTSARIAPWLAVSGCPFLSEFCRSIPNNILNLLILNQSQRLQIFFAKNFQ